jgi:hypothetical protein
MSFSLLSNARTIQSSMLLREEATSLARLGNAPAKEVRRAFSIRIGDSDLLCPNCVYGLLGPFDQRAGCIVHRFGGILGLDPYSSDSIVHLSCRPTTALALAV